MAGSLGAPVDVAYRWRSGLVEVARRLASAYRQALVVLPGPCDAVSMPWSFGDGEPVLSPALRVHVVASPAGTIAACFAHGNLDLVRSTGTPTARVVLMTLLG